MTETLGFLRTDFSRSVSRLFIAIAVTLGGSCLAYALLGEPPLIGVDDANITQVYARNIADGHGYVYTPGHERVEGSTSFLWTLINVAAFTFSPRPEIFLVVVAGLLTVGSIVFFFRIFELILRSAGIRQDDFLIPVGLFLLCMPGYYGWSVLSLMETALWTFLLNGGVLSCLLRIDGRIGRRESLVLLSLFSALIGLTRPEAMLLVPALLSLGVAAEWKSEFWSKDTMRVYGAAYMASLLTTAGLALFRVTYFGVPFPNTYYAKVSHNPIDNLINGLIYFGKFIYFSPLGAVLVLAAVICFVVATWQLYFAAAPRQLHRCLFVLGGAIVLVLGLPFITGGDHFDNFRMYQPVYPLLLLLVMSGVVAGLEKLQSLKSLPKALCAMIFIAVFATYSMAMAVDFSLKRQFAREFEFAARGRALGGALNELLQRAPGTRVAVIAAGGVALTYKGRIIDLMGLNWPRMAHATERRMGLQGHSSFDARIFREEMPELVTPRLSGRFLPGSIIAKNNVKMLDGLPNLTWFRKTYAPVAIPVVAGYIITFARRDWISIYARSGRIQEISWPAHEAGGVSG